MSEEQGRSSAEHHAGHPEEKKILVPIVKFSPELQRLQNNQKQNGVYFKTHNQTDEALKYFSAAHEMLTTDYMPIFNSSLCHFDVADISTAKDECVQALQLCPAKHELMLRHHLIDCVYNENYFEDALIDAHNTLRRNDGHFNKVECRERIHALRSTLDYVIGEYAGPCLFNLRQAIKQLDEIRKTESKPLKKACGVSSAPDVVRKKLKPLLKKRIEQNRLMIDNVYLLQTSHDYSCLGSLLNDKRLYLKQTAYTNHQLRAVVNPTVDRITRWRLMLNERQPLYSKKFNMIQNERKAAEYHQAIMNRTELQTRRDIFEQLVKVRLLSAQGKVQELVDYTISVLQYYYSIKTTRIFPRIFEFRNELCNIVGISFLNQISIPKDLMSQAPFERFPYLIGAKAHDKGEDNTFSPVISEFGDREAFIKLHSVDTSYLTYKHRVQSLEQLNESLESPIEKCLISYEVSRMHLAQIKIDEARTMARKVVENADECGNYVWLYLGHLQNARCDAIQQNLAHIKQKLHEMDRLCFDLNEYIAHFTHVAIRLNQVDIETKEREEREKREELEAEEALRQERRDLFLRMSYEHESQPGITPKDVRRHSQSTKIPILPNP